MSEPDFNCYDSDKLDFELLDPGVREVVRWLISMGFNTTDSGDGKHKMAHEWEGHECELIPFPHVFMSAPSESLLPETHRLVLGLKHIGIEAVAAWSEEGKVHVEASYDPVTQEGTIMLVNVTSDMIPK